MSDARTSNWPTATPLAAPDASEPDEMLGADVRREERGADEEPAGVAVAEEITLGGFARGTLPGDRERDDEDQREVRGDHHPVERREAASCRHRQPRCGASRRTRRGPARSRAAPDELRSKPWPTSGWRLPCGGIRISLEAAPKLKQARTEVPACSRRKPACRRRLEQADASGAKRRARRAASAGTRDTRSGRNPGRAPGGDGERVVFGAEPGATDGRGEAAVRFTIVPGHRRAAAVAALEHRARTRGHTGPAAPRPAVPPA